MQRAMQPAGFVMILASPVLYLIRSYATRSVTYDAVNAGQALPTVAQRPCTATGRK
jgi:hypothetical protein